MTELTSIEPDQSRIVSSGNALPLPFVLRAGQLGEEHEGVLVSFTGVALYSDIGNGEWVVTVSNTRNLYQSLMSREIYDRSAFVLSARQRCSRCE